MLKGTSSGGNLSAISSVGGIGTVGTGVPIEVATAAQVNQSANVASATLYAVPSAGAGIYRVSAYAVESQAATTSSTLPSASVGWTDGDTNTALVSNTVTSTNTANAIGAFGTGSIVISAKAGTNITYATTGYASSGATAMLYAVRFRVEYLG